MRLTVILVTSIISKNIPGEGNYNEAVIWLDKADSIPLASADVREGIKVSGV